MTKLVGVEKVIETAEKLGITTIKGGANTYGLTVGLGSAEVKLFELSRAFSVFANSGKLAGYSGISKVVDNEKTVIYEKKMSTYEAIDPRVAYIMTSILSDNKARSTVFGSNSPLYFKDRTVAAKTGTTDDYNDSWTVGFSPQYTVGVWMGNNDRSKMARVSGVEGAAYIWHDVMADIHLGLPAESFTKPDGLSEVWVNPSTSAAVKKQSNPNILEYFLPGTEPSEKPSFDYLDIFKKTKKTTID
jgi:membrane peptidoglycan carboxypeptidase